jgi:hypothetical protein
MIWFEQTGITTPFTLPQFPFVQTVGRQSQDNLNAAFPLAQGPAVAVTPPNPNSGLGQGVFGVDRNNGSGYSQQWNVTVQKSIGESLNFEAGYLGSKNTRLGVPDVNLNQLPAGDLSLGSALAARVPNPYFGQIPASSSLGAQTIAHQQLLRPYPRFTTVALFRDNVGNSTYHAVTAKLEKRLSRGLTFTFAYTFSKLIDDASAVSRTPSSPARSPITPLPTLSTATWRRIFRTAISRGCFRRDGYTRFRGYGSSRDGGWRAFCGRNRAIRWPSRRPPT